MQDEDNQVPDEALTAFMTHCSTRIGDAYFRTPRNTVKEFVNMLSVLEQNPGADWRDLLGSVKPETTGTWTPKWSKRTRMMNSYPSSSSTSPSTAFDRLAEPVRRWIWDKGWGELHDIREYAIFTLPRSCIYRRSAIRYSPS